ncbi:MAG: SMI1/KNR4 family protein [Dolichospermum circinale Clear-D4]|nr:SMI1/KNR4 family protein [Dolichospermum circinale Clear-D4]
MKQYQPASSESINAFIESAKFQLPNDFVVFFSESNGVEKIGNNGLIRIWPIEELFIANKEYAVDEFAPDYFLIGSNGGTASFAIQKSTGDLYEIPFIDMSNEQARFVCKTIFELLKSLND